MSGTPYRKPGEPARVPKDLRRWYTKPGDVEKGPYDALAIHRSLKEGYVKPTTLVRAEDELEWRPLSSVRELVSPGVLRPTGAVLARAAHERSEPPPPPRGNYWAGFAVSLVAGLIGLVIILVASKETETRRGALPGFLTRIGLTVVLVALMFLFQH